MKRALLVALLAATCAAQAQDRIYREGADEVRIFEGPCVSIETINRIPKEQRDGWKKAVGTVADQRFFGCWREFNGTVFILWEDGDQGLIPVPELKPVPEV